MHVLVDGSNVAQGLPSLRRVWRQDRDRARDLLVSMAREIHDGWSWQVTVVFDGRGSEIACSYPWGVDTFAVIFSPSNLTADAVIERMGLRSADPSRIAVVSADHMILDSLRAAGAQTVSPQVFEEWVEACRRSIREKSDRRDHSSAGAFENRLDIRFHPES
ncbi:MAG TPA: NYN domain-containing protein [Opitutales bacterium]|nr:NYN domain-containing protein [Opitutales bacterium]